MYAPLVCILGPQSKHIDTPGVAGVIRFRSHTGASPAVTEQMDVDHIRHRSRSWVTGYSFQALVLVLTCDDGS
jgi:hypothetical protein